MITTKLPKWSDRTKFEKCMYIFQVILAIIMIILCGLQFSGIYNGVDFVLPILGATMILLFLQYKKYNKTMSYAYLATAIFCFACCLRIFLMVE